MRLNKYLAHCGIGTRRQADVHIRKGRVTINNIVVDNPAVKVEEDDIVAYEGKVIVSKKDRVYILMNKPKLFTCNYDPDDNKSIAKILLPKVKNVVSVPISLRKEDRGLILLTDDPEVNTTLQKPGHTIKQVYELSLDKEISEEDMEAIRNGISIEDNLVKVHGIDYLTNEEKNKVGITSHIVDDDHLPQVFECLGYKIEVLDRMYIAGLTKKDLPRGFFRSLTQKEIIFLRHFF